MCDRGAAGKPGKRGAADRAEGKAGKRGGADQAKGKAGKAGWRGSGERKSLPTALRRRRGQTKPSLC